MQSARILVVDDEPQLRRLIQIFLTKQGHTVDVCEDAASALNLLTGKPSEYRVIVADLSMPGMQGDDMAFRMLEINPDLLVLLCSGYPYDLEMISADKRGRFGTLQKPFTPTMLTDAVDELLNR